jgi:hypothetical protein
MNVRIVICSVIVCLLVINSDGAEIHGLVLDQESKPLAGKVITLIPDHSSRLDMEAKKETTTTQSGEFSFVDLGIGNYYLMGPGKGYRAQPIEISEPTTIYSEIIFKPITARHILNVRILQIPDNSNPIMVRLLPGPATVMSIFNTHGINSLSDPSTYVFTNLYEGSYTLSVENSSKIRSICTVNMSDKPEQFSFTEPFARLNPFTVILWQDEHEQDGHIWSTENK